jgi:hypothetical protein
MLLQFLDVIFKLMENFGMWTDQKHFGDARHRGGGLYFILYEFVLHNLEAAFSVLMLQQVG